MTYLAPVEDARTQLINALAAWDYSLYFPADYDATMTKGVDVTANWPADQLRNIQAENNGQLVKPIISVVGIDPGSVPGDGSVLGNILGPGFNNPALLQHGRTLEITFQVDCWADMQTGGGDQAERIAGGVMDCLFVNQNTLSSYRRVKAAGGRPSYDEVGQLWRCTLRVSGRLVTSYDA